jgi:hypothetical protein
LSDILVQDCYLAGGGWTVYGGNTTAVRVQFIDNTFGRDYFPQAGYWGPVAYQAPDSNGNVWSGNVFDDGSPV